MSRDAVIVTTESGKWMGSHDGPCTNAAYHLRQGEFYSLSELIVQLETCLGSTCHWQVRLNREGEVYLVGYVAPSGNIAGSHETAWPKDG